MALLLSLKRTVNLEPGLTAPQVFHVSQNDVGTKLYVGLEQGGTAYTIPENTTAKVQGCNALGEPFEAIMATVSTNEVYFTITDQDVTQFAGNAKCEVVLTNGTNILGSANFIVAVEASPMGSDVPAIYTNPVQAYIEGVVQDYVDDDVLPDITADIESKADASDVGNLTELETTDKTSIVGAVNEVVSGKVAIAQGSENAGKALVVNSSGSVEPADVLVSVDGTLSVQGDAADAKATGDALALKANASTVAPEFSDQITYTAGSYVLKNGVLYKFTSDHSAGAWTETDAETVTVGKELTDLKVDLSVLVPSNLVSGTYTKNKYVRFNTGDIINSINFSDATDYIDVSECERIVYSRIYSTSTSTQYGIAFYNENKEYVSGVRCVLSQPEMHYELSTVDVPENAKYVRLTEVQALGAVCVYNADEYNTKIPVRLKNAETEIKTLQRTVEEFEPVVSSIETLSTKVDTTEFKLSQFSQNGRLETLIEDGNIIPLDEYNLVEYIAANAGNSNTVNIGTGLFLGPNLRTEFDMALTELSGSNYMGREGVNNKAIRNSVGYNGNTSETGFYFGFGNENLSLGTADTKRHLFFIDVPNLKYGVDNTEETKSAFTYSSDYSTREIYLLGVTMSAINSKAKLYSAKFYESGELIAYFVPVVRLADNRAGMYDVVRNAFYTNAGSGTLIAGPSKGNGGTSESELLIKKTEITDAYSAHFNSSESVDGYLFFTDPHIYRAEVTEDTQMELFKQLELAYNSTPTRFLICGGDWLQGGAQDIIPGGPTPAQACGQLGYVTGVMGKLFKNYYPVFGNHDGNYKNTALPRQTVINLMFPDQGKCYYTLKSGETRYYIFDTTTDSGLGNMTDYKKEQLDWFVAQLLENTADEHIVIVCHIFTNNYTSAASDSDICLQMKDALAVANAYNLRVADYALPWTTTVKNFSECTGTIHYCIAGHTHHDLLGEYAGIPVLLTQNALHNYVQPTFDLVAFDHDSNTLYTNRIGNGANRILHCTLISVSTAETLTPSIVGTLTWASLDETVATVTGGTVTAVSSGYALISATNENGEVEAWVVSII